MFKIINASAGSGKTFVLVKEYLIRLLSDKSNDGFKTMIALTFTNKAVFEMKNRIISNLAAFSINKNKAKYQLMFDLVKKELKLSDNILELKSKLVLKKILHQYASFEIETLDRFTLKIIRSFFKDLNLSYRFQVEVNSKIILEEVVERIIDKVGKDILITQLLERFSFQKMEALLSTDLSSNLYLIARLLIREQDLSYINKLKLNSLEKYSQNELELKKIKEFHLLNLSKIADKGLSLIEKNKLDFNDFKLKQLPNHFENLKLLKPSNLFKNKLEGNLKNGLNIYNKTLDQKKKDKIDSLIQGFLNLYEESKKEYYSYILINELRKHWIPMSLVKAMKDEIDLIQKEKNTILLATFNQIINKEILNYPTPYIYEKLGEKYKHFFIDEFQDTSRLQWKNLIPLIANSLESIDLNNKSGSLLLVGDPKQSIYRWRGGDVKQFIDLLAELNPFQIKNEIFNLKLNYRSSNVIVNFNNSFFKSIFNSLSTDINQLIFESASNQLTNNSGGYVQIDQINDKSNEENYKEIYAEKAIEKVRQVLEMNYTYSDMAILVRKKDQASAISKSLSFHNYPFISSESLLVSSSEKVKLLISLIELSLDESCKMSRKIILDYLHHDKSGLNNQELPILLSLLNGSIKNFFLKNNKEFDFQKFKNLSLYEAFEYAIYSFGFSIEIDACVNSLMDFIFQFSIDKSNDIKAFLSFWEKEKEGLYVSLSEGVNAIQVLTIHKSKGLEFPIVILPFADEYLQPKIKDQVWINTEDILNKSFSYSLINFSENLKMLGEKGKELYEKVYSENEFDALAVLYVSFTRAIDQMYIITKQQNSKTNSYATLIGDFIESNESNFINGIMEFGKKESRQKTNTHIEIKNNISFNNKIYPWQEKLFNYCLNDVSKATKIKKKGGIVIHELLSKIDTDLDIDWVVKEAIGEGKIKLEDKKSIKELLKEVVMNPKIEKYFSREFKIFKEREVVTTNSEKIRIDRIMIKGKTAIIMEYKTGIEKNEDILQVNHYEQILNQTNLKVIKKIIVYMKENPINIKSF